MMKILQACLARGHQVTVFTLRWEAPLPTSDYDVVVVPIEGLHRHHHHVIV